jgi:hypothetical protein
MAEKRDFFLTIETKDQLKVFIGCCIRRTPYLAVLFILAIPVELGCGYDDQAQCDGGNAGCQPC